MRTRGVGTHLRRLIASGLLLMLSAAAAGGASAERRALKLQGTWHAENAGSGTWAIHAQVERPEILRGKAEETAWEGFSGTLRAAGIAGLEEGAPVSGWMVDGKIAVRILRAPWDTVVMVGTVDGSRISGTVTTPDGRTGTWEGWWIAPKPAPPVDDKEPRLGAVEE